MADGRNKCRATIAALTDESTRHRCGFEWLDITLAELMLYISPEGLLVGLTFTPLMRGEKEK